MAASWPGLHKRSKPDPVVSMPLPGYPAGQACTTEASNSLLTLQNNVLEQILLNLHLTDLARCCEVCKGLKSIVQQDEIWQLLCASNFPSLSAVDLKQWLRSSSIPAAPASCQKPVSIPAAFPSKAPDVAASYRFVLLVCSVN